MPVPNATFNAVLSLEKCRPPVPLPTSGKYLVEGKAAHPVMTLSGAEDPPILILVLNEHSRPSSPLPHFPPERRPHRVMLARPATEEEQKAWTKETDGSASSNGLMTIQLLAPAGQLGKFVPDTKMPPVSYLPTI